MGGGTPVRRRRGELERVRVWQGRTPDGYALLVERDAGGQWIATVAAASRSRNASLEAAILEAAGRSAPRSWAARLSAAIAARYAETSRASRSSGRARPSP